MLGVCGLAGDLAEAGSRHGSEPGSLSPAGPSSTDSVSEEDMNLSAEEQAAKSLVASVLKRVTSHLDGPANIASMQEPVVHSSEEPAQLELQPQPQHLTPVSPMPQSSGMLACGLDLDTQLCIKHMNFLVTALQIGVLVMDGED